MVETVQRITQGGLTRDEARRERREESQLGPRPQPFIFNYEPDGAAYKLRIQFRKSHVTREELAATLRSLLESIEQSNFEEDGGIARAAASGERRLTYSRWCNSKLHRSVAGSTGCLRFVLRMRGLHLALFRSLVRS